MNVPTLPAEQHAKFLEISAKCKGLVSWEESGLIGVRIAFCREMRFKQYGREQTRDAWLMFVSGWLAAKEHDLGI